MSSKKFLIEFFGVLGAVAAFLLIGFANLPTHNLEITFLDVGQGDAILIRTPSNQKILIDAGPAGAVLPALSEELSFWERKIQLAVLTHPDTDHVAGFTEILRRYEIESILLTGVQHETQWYDEILRQIAEQKIPTIIATAESDLRFGEVIFDNLWPLENLAGQFVSDANAASITTRIIFGETAVVLTGDLDIDSEKELLATPAFAGASSPNLSAQILKLGHHGSRTSSSTEFLSAVNPDFAIISVSEDNKFGHPHSEVLERLEEVEIIETAKEGNIKFVSNGEVWVQNN